MFVGGIGVVGKSLKKANEGRGGEEYVPDLCA